MAAPAQGCTCTAARCAVTRGLSPFQCGCSPTALAAGPFGTRTHGFVRAGIGMPTGGKQRNGPRPLLSQPRDGQSGSGDPSALGMLMVTGFFARAVLTRIRRMKRQFDVVLRRIRYNNQYVNVRRMGSSWRTQRVNRSMAL
jgi:hypothetical protein